MPKRSVRSAVALRWDESMPARLVVAKGSGLMAERLDGSAKGAGVPIVRNDGIVAGLEPIDIGNFVPPEYWDLVASVLVFIRKVRA